MKLVELLIWSCLLSILLLIILQLHGAFIRQRNKPLHLSVIDKKHQADYVILRLARRSRTTLPAYKAGQHIKIHLKTPFGNAVRAYSLAGWQRHPHCYELAIKAQGKYSNYLFNEIEVGQQLQISRPQGTFYAEPAQQILLLAGGIGITPMRAMLQFYLSQKISCSVTLLYAARNEQQLLYHDEFLELTAQANFNYVPILSQPNAGWSGLTGRVDNQLIRSIQPKTFDKAYLCAGETLQQACTQWLIQNGLSDSKVHTELYQVNGSGRAGMVSLAQQTFFYPGQGSLLQALEENGLPIPADCRNGSCGICRLKLHSGEIIELKPAELVLPKQHILACCSAPDGDITVSHC